MSGILVISNKPAASVTDEEVAEVIAFLLEDPRVSKAVHAGREAGEGGRQLIDFAMTGFEGVHTVGRVISALGEEQRQADKAAKLKAASDAKAAKKAIADTKDLKLIVPPRGKNAKFETYLAGIGKADAAGDERTDLYVSYMLPRLESLTGTIAQRAWAADIREGYTSQYDEQKRAKIFKKFKAAKFWIDGQRGFGLRATLDAVR